MQHACRRASIAMVILAAACADGITLPQVQGPDAGTVGRTLMDGSQPNAPVQGFYFLPPTVVAPPASFSGTFDPGLAPVIEICPLAADDPASATACSRPLLATLDMTSDVPEAIRLDARAENYSSTWFSTLRAGSRYRAFVRVGATTLGYVDLFGTRKQKDRPPAGFVGVVAGQPFVFKFRIETGIAGTVSIAPTAATIRDIGTPGESQVFTATVRDLHGDPLAGAQVEWSAGDPALIGLAPASGTTDAAGTTTTTATPLDRVTVDTGVDVMATVMSSAATARLTVRPSSRPIGQPDAWGVVTGNALAVTAAGVLLNDFDPEGDPLTVGGVTTGPEHGTLSLQPDGSFLYTPGPGFIGTDGFEYIAVDPNGNESMPVPVTLEVIEASDPAPVTLPDHFVAIEGKLLNVAARGFLFNDIDPNGEAISAIAIGQNVQNGTLGVFGDGGFRYEPNEGFTGTDAFTYVARNASGHVADPTTVTLEVVADPDRVPVGMPDRFVVIEGGFLNIQARGFLANDVDSDGLPLTAVAIGTNVQHGTVGVFGDGGFAYTPAPGYVGSDGFTYVMSNSAGVRGAPVAVSIEVLPASTTGPLATPDVYAVVEGRTLAVTAPTSGFLANDRDAQGGAISATQIVDNVDHGMLAAFADGTFSYTPAAGFTGTDQFTYRMQAAGIPADATVTIEVLPDPDKDPIAVADVFTVYAGSTRTIAAAGFLINDINPDGGAVTAIQITDAVDHGTLSAFADGSFAYTPDAGFTGTDMFTYRMRNDATHTAEAVVTLHVVEDPNRAPLALPDHYALLAGGSLTVLAPGFLRNDVDPEGEAITATQLVDNVDHGTLAAFPDGSFSYTPAPGFAGTDNFVYRARDEAGRTADATVTLAVIDPAVASASLLARLRARPEIIAAGSETTVSVGAEPLSVGEARVRAMPGAIQAVSPLQGDPLPVVTRERADRPDVRTPDLSAFGGRQRLEVVRNR